MDIKKILLQNGLELIPINEVDIKLDIDINVGYDFTIPDNYTFNTYDGIYLQDTMAVFFPLTEEAQAEARELLYKAIASKNDTESLVDMKHEVQLGAFLLTKEASKKLYNDNKHIGKIKLDDIRKDKLIGIKNSFNIYDKCELILDNNKKIQTFLGKAIFNSCFPANVLIEHFNSFIDLVINSSNFKFIVNKLTNSLLIDNAYEIIDIIKDICFQYATVYPIGLILGEFLKSEKFDDLKNQFSKSDTMDQKQIVTDKIVKELKENIADTIPMLSTLVDSNARGGIGQIKQIFVSKGIIQDVEGNIKSINGNYTDGLDSTSYFLNGYAARKGIMDRVRATSVTGYLMRKLIYACASVLLDPNLNDCKTKKTVSIKITKNNMKLLTSRYIVENNNLILLTESNIKSYLNKIVNLRSPIYCKSLKICKTCFGTFIKKLHTQYVGILSAQTIGERGTQEIMKTFHTGGATSLSIINIFEECRNNNPNINIEELKKIFKQDKISILAKEKNIKLIFKSTDYLKFGSSNFTVENIDKSKIVSYIKTEDNENKLFLTLPFMSCNVKSNNIDDLFIIEVPLFIDLSKFEINEYLDKETRSKIIELTYIENINEEIFRISSTSTDLNNAMQFILGVIEKKNIIIYPETALHKLSSLYGDKFKVAYVFIEILISQLFRNKSRPEWPARIIEPYDSKIYGIKYIPRLESWLSSLLFENIQKSLETGLLSDRSIMNPLEKLLSNDLDF